MDVYTHIYVHMHTYIHTRYIHAIFGLSIRTECRNMLNSRNFDLQTLGLLWSEAQGEG